jgi:hypothetical protein
MHENEGNHQMDMDQQTQHNDFITTEMEIAQTDSELELLISEAQLLSSR